MSDLTRLAGVIGWPIGHSKSPRLHGHWLARYGIEGAYLPLAVAPDRLPAALAGLPALGFKGCNVTVPHKETALPFLDSMTETVKRLGAVNTIVVTPDGGLHGDNTDGHGFMASLRATVPDWSPEATGDRPAVILGAGGAARAIAVALADAGVTRIAIVNRTREKAEAVAALVADGSAPSVHGFESVSGPDGLLSRAAIVINTTVLGMDGQPPLQLPLDHLAADAVVADIVYAPLMTDLLSQAAGRGNPVVTGIGMLLHQAVPGFQAWFGVTPVVDDALEAAVLDRKAQPAAKVEGGG